MPFTAEELAELAEADAEIEANFHIEREEILRSEELDKVAREEGRGKRVEDPERHRVWYQKNRESVLRYQKAYCKANMEKVKARKRDWYQRNRERVRAQQKAYRAANKEKIAARNKAYREDHREEIAAKRRAKRRAAES